MSTIEVSAVRVVDRHRVNMGDLDSLVESLRDLGQLQPIVVTQDLRLIAGGRRLAAARSLGWSTIEANIVDGLSDATAMLRAERDENTCRKAFTPTEEHSVYEALLALSAKSDADSQQEAGGGVKRSVAEIVSGNAGRFKTLEKVGDVKRIANDETLPDQLREKARTALAEMDQSGNVAGPHAGVMLAARTARRSDDLATWSSDERALREELVRGHTVVVSLRENHANLVRWAQAEGFLEPVDRRSEWGNPFEIPYDGDRETVIRNYAEHYLPYKPSLLSRIPELKGKALACWCAPDPCHADVLKQRAENP